MTAKDYVLLKVYLNIIGDVKVDFQPFKPAQAFFFSTKVLLDGKLLKKNNISLKQLFQNLDVFMRALKFLKEKNNTGDYTPEQIVRKNLDVFRKTFLGKNETIPIGSTSKFFTIIESNTINDPAVLNNLKTVLSTRNRLLIAKKNNYEVVYEVYVLNDNRWKNSSKLSDMKLTSDEIKTLKKKDVQRAECRLKATRLNKQFKDLTDFSLGLNDEIPIYIEKTTPTTTSPFGFNLQNNNLFGITNNRNEIEKREIERFMREKKRKEITNLKDRLQTMWGLDDNLRRNISMDQYIKEQISELYKNNFRDLWEKYKDRHENASVSKWIEEKEKQDLYVNTIDLLKQWETYKTHGSMNLQDWLREMFPVSNPLLTTPVYGGKRNKSKINKSKINKSKSIRAKGKSISKKTRKSYKLVR